MGFHLKKNIYISNFLHGAKNINPAMSLDLLRFPNRTFAKFPTDSLKRMFTKSFTIVKNKDIKLHAGEICRREE